MAREIPYIGAINEAIHQEMERDESVLYFGQNMATTPEDPFLKAFGPDRVRVTPISETAEIGMGVGAAPAGSRPVGEFLRAEFLPVKINGGVKGAPPSRYRPGGGGRG